MMKEGVVTLTNPFKARLGRKEPLIGLWVDLTDACATEIVAGAGFDWLLIDGEHGPNTLQTILAQLQALQGSASQAVVRPAWNDPVAIKQVLDLGAQTLLVPMIQSADEARAAVAAMRYPPDGVRGVAAAVVRASRWGREENYITRANAEICTLVQVETPRGVAALDAILAVDGVDGVFVGPADLAANMGYPGQGSHPDVIACIDDSITKIAASGKAAGILDADPARARHYIDLGAKFVAVGLDVTLLARAAEALRRQFD